MRPSLIDHIKQNGCCEQMLLSFAILKIRIIKLLILMMNGIIKHLIFEDQNRWWNSMVSLNIPTFCVRSLNKTLRPLYVWFLILYFCDGLRTCDGLLARRAGISWNSLSNDFPVFIVGKRKEMHAFTKFVIIFSSAWTSSKQ